MQNKNVSSTLNKSSAKTAHKFSNSSRFPSTKQWHNSANPNNSECKSIFKTDFDKTQEKKNPIQSFGGRQGRFEYYSSPRKQGKLPSPAQYTLEETFSPTAATKRYSIGLGREQVKPVHIDEAINQKKNNPDVGKYDPKKTFGSAGTHFSIRKRMYRYG